MKSACVENYRDEYTVRRLCRVLSVRRTGYCQWHVRAPSARAFANKALDSTVQRVHREIPGSYGRSRITQQLREQGERVSAERVRQSLRHQELRPVGWRPCVVTPDSRHRLPVTPNLLDRRFDDLQPSRTWMADITYVSTGEGWLYGSTRRGNGRASAVQAAMIDTVFVLRY